MSSNTSELFQQPGFFPINAAEWATIVVNANCEIREQNGMRAVMVRGMPVFHYHRDDRTAEDLFAAQAQTVGFATGGELARALGRGVRTLQRRSEQYERNGVKGLLAKKTGPKGARLGAAREAAIRKWHSQEVSGHEMARRLRVSPGTVRNTLRRLGLAAPPTKDQQQSLPLADTNDERGTSEQPLTSNETAVTEVEAAAEAEVEAAAEAEVEAAAEAEVEAAAEEEVATETEDTASVPARAAFVSAETLDTDPMNREIDRMLAANGKLFDAVPLFAPGEQLPRVGVLLAIPLIVSTGIFEEAEKLYSHIGPAFYGLRTTLLTLIVLALLRVKRPENLKEYSPPELGRVLGLDRAPEVKTLRRKLRMLAAGPSEQLLDAIIKRRVKSRSEAMGFLYVDGHVRVYSGKFRIPKTHIARMRFSGPATQDFWVNDADGEPVFFVTQEAHPSMTSALPPLLENARELVGDNRRITVVFDRGGWSQQLFQALDKSHFDVLTYRKGTTDPIPEALFDKYVVPGSEGKKTWLLHERSVWVGGEKTGLWMRQVTRLKGDHQTHIMTTRQDLEITEVASRMFARWQQENFFKYMRQEFAIDSLIEYGFEEEDQLREMPNPRWNRADRAWKKAKTELGKLLVAQSEAESKGVLVPVELLDDLQVARAKVAEHKSVREGLLKRVTIRELNDDERTVRLPVRRRQLSDGLKMLAYQVESDLVRAIAPHYRRSDDEGRTLVAAVLQSSGDLAIVGDQLRVILAPQSSPHRTRVIATLCEELNATDTRFPGTGLRLCYAIKVPECVN